MTDPLRFRQSRLRSFVQCPRRAVLESEHTTGLVGSAAHLGSAGHAVFAEILRTLRRGTEPCIAGEDGIAIMREVVAAGPWVLGAADYDWLVQFTLAFCEMTWTPQDFMAVEERLSAEVPGPDGELRLLTGTPDLVIREDHETAAIVDFKTGMGVNRDPRVAPEDGEPIRGAEYQSAGADFQLAAYGFLVAREWSWVKTVVLRELNLRWLGPPRESMIRRTRLEEHTGPYLGDLMMKVDRALEEGEGSEFAQPRPHPKQCTTRCSVARSCPVPKEQRGLGALETAADAVAEAERLVVITALRTQMLGALKSRHENVDEYIMVGDLALGWHTNGDGRRRFDFKELGT